MNHTRCIYTVWNQPAKSGGLWLYVAAEGFQEFFGVSSEEVTKLIGNGWVELRAGDIETYISKLKTLLKSNYDKNH